MDTAAICCALGNKTRYQLIMALKNETISTCCNRSTEVLAEFLAQLNRDLQPRNES